MSKSTRRNILPGFGLSMGYTLAYLSLLILIPLSSLVFRAVELSWSEFVEIITSPRVLASFRLTFGLSAAAALTNAALGTIVAWTLVRYRFPGRRILDAIVDLPFALPTAVSGIALAAVYSANGPIGQWLEPLGIKVAFSALGIYVALVFIGFPFVVRTLQPTLEELDGETEEASASLGANRIQTLARVIAPTLIPSIITGFALAFARAVGEYGSVIFISSNMPMKSEISSLLIVSKLEQYDVAGATAIALVMLSVSFLALLSINGLQRWVAFKFGREA